jgi:hypothetical protein
MKAKLLLRIACGMMLLHTIGHTMGAMSWKNAPNPAIARVISGMQSNHFDFMGRTTSLASFYAGYGYIMVGVLLLITVLLWQLSSAPARGMLLVLGSFLIFMAIMEYIYFFPMPAAFSLLAGLGTLAAAYQVSKIKTNNNV